MNLQNKVKEAEEKHSQIQSQGEALRQRLEDLSPQHDTAKDNVQKLKKTVKTLEVCTSSDRMCFILPYLVQSNLLEQLPV